MNPDIRPKRITGAYLRKIGAEEDCIEVFDRAWPDGAEVTVDNVLRAMKLSLDILWLAEVVLPPSAWVVFRRLVSLAWEVGEKKSTAAWEAFRRAAAGAWEAYDKPTLLALQEYRRVAVTVEKAYQQVVATAWVAAWLDESAPEGKPDEP